MTIAIQRANSDILWFDAVEGFDETLSSTVTRNPIATGGLISDHTIRDNKKLSIRGILSDADFNYNRPVVITNADGTTTTYQVGKEQYSNNTLTSTAVSIVANGSSAITALLPSSITQFTGTIIPTVTVTEQMKTKSADAVKLDMIAMWQTSELFTVLDYEGDVIKHSWPNCTFTRLSFSETPDGGDAIYPNMDIEQVTYVDVQNVNIKIINKGRQSTTTTTGSAPTDSSGTGATTLSTKTSQLATAVDSATTTN